MTDELVKRLDDLDPILETDFDTQLAVERDPYGATRAIEAALYMLRDQAARIKDLTGQNLRLSGMCYDLKKEVAISDALLISEAEVSLERLARAEAAEAERDRLDGMGIAEPDYDIDPDDDFLDAANSEWVRDTLTRLAAALKGESHE